MFRRFMFTFLSLLAFLGLCLRVSNVQGSNLGTNIVSYFDNVRDEVKKIHTQGSFDFDSINDGTTELLDTKDTFYYDFISEVISNASRDKLVIPNIPMIPLTSEDDDDENDNLFLDGIFGFLNLNSSIINLLIFLINTVIYVVTFIIEVFRTAFEYLGINIVSFLNNTD